MKGQTLLFVTALIAGVVSGVGPMDALPKPDSASALPLPAAASSYATPAAAPAPWSATIVPTSQIDVETVGPLEQRLIAICESVFPQAAGHDHAVVRGIRIAGGVVFLLLVLGVSWVVGWEHKKGKL